MSRLTARFSNGRTDSYSGKRAVAVAWMATLPCGYCFTGFSRDQAAANKTARSYMTIQCPHEGGAERTKWIDACKVEIVDVVDAEEMERINQMIANIYRMAGTLD